MEQEGKDYKFREDEILDELRKYIEATYNQHYAKGLKNLQALEIAIDRGRAMDFILTSIDKYSGRYTEKGDDPDAWRKDLMKIAHYAILALYVHDLTYEKMPGDILEIDQDSMLDPYNWIVDDDELDISDITISKVDI